METDFEFSQYELDAEMPAKSSSLDPGISESPIKHSDEITPPHTGPSLEAFSSKGLGIVFNGTAITAKPRAASYQITQRPSVFLSNAPVCEYIPPDNRQYFSRTAANDIKNHPYFSKVEWDKVENRTVTPPFIPTALDMSQILAKPTDLCEDYPLSAQEQALFNGFGEMKVIKRNDQALEPPPLITILVDTVEESKRSKFGKAIKKGFKKFINLFKPKNSNKRKWGFNPFKRRDNAKIVETVEEEQLKLSATEANLAFRSALDRRDFKSIFACLDDERVDPSFNDNFAIRISCALRVPYLVEKLLNHPRVDPAADNNFCMRSAITSRHLVIMEMLARCPQVDITVCSGYGLIAAVEGGNLDLAMKIFKLDWGELNRYMDRSKKNHGSTWARLYTIAAE